MHFLLVPYGTAGDVFPFIGIGAGLKTRGHDVSVITHTCFGETVRRCGLDFVDLNDAERYHATMEHPDHWDPHKGMKLGADFLLQDGMPKQYAAVERLYVPGKTAAVTSHLGYGVRIAQDKFGIPVASAHITPFQIRSVSRPSAQPVYDWLRRALKARFLRAGAAWLLDVVADRMLGPEVNRFRAGLGLPPIRRIFGQWIHSSQCMLGLFPQWLAEPLPDDWPAIHFTGFPFFDAVEGPLAPEVAAYLDQGPPPIVFSPGSAVAHVTHFFAAAVEVCQALNQRGLLLTRFPEQVPAPLPDSIRRVDYVPHSQVLPRCAALVSHGGAGTMSQGVRAALPQVIMPMNYDQPEHARRLTELGVARTILPWRFTGPALTRVLGQLLNDADVRVRCRKLADTLVVDDPVAVACARLEEFARRYANAGTA